MISGGDYLRTERESDMRCIYDIFLLRGSRGRPDFPRTKGTRERSLGLRGTELEEGSPLWAPVPILAFAYSRLWSARLFI